MASRDTRDTRRFSCRVEEPDDDTIDESKYFFFQVLALIRENVRLRRREKDLMMQIETLEAQTRALDILYHHQKSARQ